VAYGLSIGTKISGLLALIHADAGTGVLYLFGTDFLWLTVPLNNTTNNWFAG